MEEGPKRYDFPGLPVSTPAENYVFYGRYMKNGTMFRDIARYAENLF